MATLQKCKINDKPLRKLVYLCNVSVDIQSRSKFDILHAQEILVWNDIRQYHQQHAYLSPKVNKSAKQRLTNTRRTCSILDFTQGQHNNQWFLKQKVFVNSIMQLNSIVLPNSHQNVAVTMTRQSQSACQLLLTHSSYII